MPSSAARRAGPWRCEPDPTGGVPRRESALPRPIWSRGRADETNHLRRRGGNWRQWWIGGHGESPEESNEQDPNEVVPLALPNQLCLLHGGASG